MQHHNFIITQCDTDGLLYNKIDNSTFSEEEQIALLKELNSISPEFMVWESDGYYSHCIAIRAKNYVLKDFKGKVTIKGSALRASTKSPKLKQLIKDIIYNILDDKNDYVEIYHKYVKEINNITDIIPWSSRKTITEAVMNSPRKNEYNVKNAIEGTEIVTGDRCHMYYLDDGSLCLAEKFNGSYSRDKLFIQLHATMLVFCTILDMKPILNYKLKKNKKLLALL